MAIKNILLSLLVFSTIALSGQNESHHEKYFNKYKKLTQQQLLDTANYYEEANSPEIALVCLNIIINTPVKDTDIEQHKIIIEALNRSAIIYYNMCDYNNSHEFLIKALLLCEKIDYKSFQPKIYNNIGNIYYRYKKYDLAKYNYSKALNLSTDTTYIVVLLNNLGSTELESGKLDSAAYFLDKSYQISMRNNNIILSNILNNMASLCQKEKKIELAHRYYHQSLIEAKKRNETEMEAGNLSDLSKLFFENNKIDSAKYYIRLSNNIAEKNSFLAILSKNYLTLSKIEELMGNTKASYQYYKIHSDLKDSIFNVEKFGDINQLQHSYEISKTNQEIEQLRIEQHIRERTIFYQRIIGIVIFCLLIGLFFMYQQKRNLGKAYKTLYEKNIEILELQENSSEKQPLKYKKATLSDNINNELLDKILSIMTETSVICNTEFSLNKLAELVQSNHAYVSQVINNSLKKNFRSLLNTYRIPEAQRILSTPDAAKYTIESIAYQVGFKSRTAFRDAFKEITGVSPNYYLKSAQENLKCNG